MPFLGSSLRRKREQSNRRLVGVGGKEAGGLLFGVASPPINAGTDPPALSSPTSSPATPLISSNGVLPSVLDVIMPWPLEREAMSVRVVAVADDSVGGGS